MPIFKRPNFILIDPILPEINILHKKPWRLENREKPWYFSRINYKWLHKTKKKEQIAAATHLGIHKHFLQTDHSRTFFSFY